MTQNSIDLAKQIVTLLKDAPRPTQIAALHVVADAALRSRVGTNRAGAQVLAVQCFHDIALNLEQAEQAADTARQKVLGKGAVA